MLYFQVRKKVQNETLTMESICFVILRFKIKNELSFYILVKSFDIAIYFFKISQKHQGSKSLQKKKLNYQLEIFKKSYQSKSKFLLYRFTYFFFFCFQKISKMKNILEKCSNNHIPLSKKIDFLCRVLFPIAFVIFNCIFWFTYIRGRDSRLIMKQRN